MAQGSSTSRICIIGAGLAGLTAAYDLGKSGQEVLLVERSQQFGGLASSILLGNHCLERFYHFLCMADDDMVELIAELDLSDQLHWTKTSTKFLCDGHLYRFGSPRDLLLFSPVPFLQRLRFGLNIIGSRYRRSWQSLDEVSARQWLVHQIGQRAYDVIWDPLLRIKFGEYHDRVSAAWIWHRICRVAKSRRRIWEAEHFGYLEEGSESLVRALVARLRRMPNVDIRLESPVGHIDIQGHRVRGVEIEGSPDTIPCTDVISTTALPLLLQMAPGIDVHFASPLRKVNYLGVVCGLLKLRSRITDSFWVNISDSQIPFNGLIEYTNLNKHTDFGGASIVYIPYYLPVTHERFTYTDEQLLAEFIRGLKRIRPDFDRSWIEEYRITRAKYAQAVCETGFSALVPPHRTPIAGLYITDSTQFYPEDRSLSAAVRVGRQVARMVHENRLTQAGGMT